MSPVLTDNLFSFSNGFSFYVFWHMLGFSSCILTLFPYPVLLPRLKAVCTDFSKLISASEGLTVLMVSGVKGCMGLDGNHV